MKIVVDVPDEEYESYALAITFGMGSAAIRRILDGTPLPKGTGRLIDADAVHLDKYPKKSTRSENYKDGYNNAIDDALNVLNEAPIIIEADKEYDVKAITRGNCMACGKELTEGVFFCKECEEKGRRKGAEE